jgi:hypothetical protein
MSYGKFNRGGLGDYKIPNGSPYFLEALTESRMHGESVHHKDSVRVRQQRERDARYQTMKDELARARAARAASGETDSISA